MADFLRPAFTSYDSTYSPMDSPFVTTLAYHPPSPVYFQGDGFPFPQTPPKPSPHFLCLSSPTDSSWSSSSSSSWGSSQRSESSFASLTSGKLPPSPPHFTITINPTLPKYAPMLHPPTPHHEIYARSKNAGSTPGAAPPLPLTRCVSPAAAGKVKALEDEQHNIFDKYKGVPDGWATFARTPIALSSLPPPSPRRANPLSLGMGMSPAKKAVEWKHGHLAERSV